MERVIPYHSNFLLGHGVDVTKFPLQGGRLVVSKDVGPILAQPKFITAQFSFIESMKDVCDALGIPPEYALKVEATLVKNPVVQECLNNVNKRNSVTVVFRVTFLQQKKCLPYDTKLEGGDMHSMEINVDQGTEKAEAGGGDNVASPGDEPNADVSHTHVVSAVEIGNELVAILNISSQDDENFKKFSSNLKETLGQSRGVLENPMFERLEKFAANMEKKLKKKHYQDVNCSIRYGCYSDHEKYPSSLTGMVKSLQGFVEKAHGWQDLFMSGGEYANVVAGDMMLKEGVVDMEKKGFFSAFSDFVSNKDSPETSLKTPIGSPHSDVDGADHDSFVVLASETDKMYYMRVTLQSANQSDDAEIESFTSFALSQYPESSGGRYEKLFIILLQLEKAIHRLQRLFNSKRFVCDDRVVEGNQILRSIQNVHMEVNETIQKLDMVTMPSEEFVANLCMANPLQTVNDYIENVMSKLPPGCDLDLLMIGKTGHGKSSTGNAILGQEKFKASASGESVTRSSCVAWGNVDGRIIKVVDTPGVCDTAEDRDSIDQAIHAISEAISQCPGGFHALLLVIRFGQRMTMEERKAIGMLKCILGENLIKTHCVCVVTHGDNFDTEIEGKKTFQEWCREETGFLKDIFEECEYRCVLFNNKSKDPKVIKGQLIELVGKVDSLKSSGTRYTNALFEYAQNQREQIITENHVPQVSQEMMRDIELVLDNLKRVAGNTQQRDKYSSELENLKRTVENLSNRVTEVEGDQVKSLVETIFSLAEVIHGEIDKIADRPNPDSPDEASGGSSFLSNGQEAYDKPGDSIVSVQDVNAEFETQAQNLQNFKDNQMKEQANQVDSKVAEKVAEKIEKENNCFPADGKVMMKNGVVKSLEDLEVGEQVLARNDQGEMCYDTVYMFGHGDPDVFSDYIVLHVAGEKSVSVSENHLVFCVRNGSEMCLSAKDICVGDELFMAMPCSSDIAKCRPVINVSLQRKRGVFAPFTKCGTVVVDGAVMSCYVDVLPHATSHKLLSPVRQLYCLSPSLLTFVNGAKKNKGIPAWAKFALRWI